MSFSSDKELIEYARWFLRNRVNAFRKDVGMCMTANSKMEHAYFPALITCIGFLDFLSGLYAGKIEGHGFVELKDYIARFLSKDDYKHLDLLYQMFRHKIAHIAYPYIVFDTRTKPKVFGTSKQRRVTWKVYASKRQQPIELTDFPNSQTRLKTKTPWPVPYDSRILISIRKFQADIINSIYGPSGYLQCIKSEPTTRAYFEKYMKIYFPP